MLCNIPGKGEVKIVVFNIVKNSAPGLDGFGGGFYQSCWEIIRGDLIELVQCFFNGANLTKYYTSFCLVLLLKVDHPESLSELRPISLVLSQIRYYLNL